MKDERKKSGGQWEEKRVEGKDGGRKGACLVRSKRGKIRDEKACLGWREVQ